MPPWRTWWALLVATPAVIACDGGPQVEAAAAPSAGVSARAPASSAPRIDARRLKRFAALKGPMESPDNARTEDKIAVGRMLFFDRRLSRDGDVSCNSCHQLDAYGADGHTASPGRKGQVGVRNSPSIYHAAGQKAQFWDGRASTVEDQAKVPILNPVEMGMPSVEELVLRLKAIPGYVEAFKKAFPADPSPISFGNVAQAIGAFERGLVTPSRWDRYLAGDRSALTTPELAGLQAFTELGCSVCHSGELVGGDSFQRAGAVERWPNQEDQGRFKVTGSEADRMVFKVPSLRNVARTAPYFHDGSTSKLEDAVRLMGRHQLGLDLTADEVAALVAWLSALTGDLPTEYIRKPELPP